MCRFFNGGTKQYQETLYKNNIDYYIRIINRMSSTPFSSGTRSRMGSFGQNMDLNYEYIFQAHKKDYDLAKYAINK